MKINKSIFLSLALVVLFITSCDLMEDPSASVVEWKNQNITYMTNMKDSVDYVKDTAYLTTGKEYYYYYKITTQGNTQSTKPLSTSTVTMNYRGRLITDVVFDQTYKGNNPVNDTIAAPITVVANTLINGVTLNLTQMHTGEIRTIILPQELCYGKTKTGKILSYSTLRFDIHLVSFSN